MNGKEEVNGNDKDHLPRDDNNKEHNEADVVGNNNDANHHEALEERKED